MLPRATPAVKRELSGRGFANIHPDVKLHVEPKSGVGALDSGHSSCERVAHTVQTEQHFGARRQ